MSLFDTSGGTPVGLGAPHNMDRMVYNRTGSATVVGELVMFDMALTATEVTTADLGATDSGFANVVSPATAGLVNGFFAICLEAATDNALMRVRVKGAVDANIDAAYTTLAPLTADFCAINAQITLDIAGVTGNKRLALPLEAHASNTQIRVLFDGIDGFGHATA